MPQPGSVSFDAIFDIRVKVPIGTWGEDTSFKAMREQLQREAQNKLRTELKGINYEVIDIELLAVMGLDGK